MTEHKQNKNRKPGSEKVWDAFAALLLFLVFLVPLLVLSAQLEETSAEFIRKQKNQMRARLIEELKSFKEDLKSGQHLYSYANSLIKDLSIANSVALASSMAGGEARKKLQQIVGQIKLKMKEDGLHGPPFFIVLADAGLKEFAWSFDSGFDIEPVLSRYKAEFLTGWSFKSIYKSFSAEIYQTFKSLRNIGPGVETFENDFFQNMHRLVLGSYVTKSPIPGQVTRVLSDIHGFRNILIYPVVFRQQKSFSGFLVFGILEEGLGSQSVLDFSLKNNVDTSILRFVSKSAVPERYKNSEADRYITLPLSETFFKIDFSTSGEELYIGVFYRLETDKNAKDVAAFLRFLKKLLFLSFFASLVMALIGKLSFPFSLRTKLTFIIFLALVVPAGLTGLVFEEISGLYQASGIDMAQARLTAKLDKIELGYREIVSRQVINILKLKSLLTNDFRQRAADEIDLIQYEKYLVKNISQSYILDRDGKSLSLRGTKKRQSLENQLIVSNGVRVLNSLSGMRINSTTRRMLDNLDFASGFAEQMLNFDDLKFDIAREAGNTKSFHNLNILSRNTMMLFPDLRSRPLRPQAVGIFSLSPEGIFPSYVRSSEGYPHLFFNFSDGLYSERLALAHRTTERLGEEFWLDPSADKSEDLTNLQRQALDYGSPGVSISGEENAEVKAWRIYETWPLVIAGIASIARNEFVLLYLQTFPYVLVLLGFLILLLMERLVSRLFIAPIECILNGIRLLRSGENPLFKVIISSSDEFENAGNAFNDMTLGILQKKHISRFVSASLIKEMAADSPQKSLRARKATVLASDIQGFTSISEKFSAEEVVEVLNAYFTEMEAAILVEGGRIDRFIGDAVIAVFFADELENSAERAIKAGLQMRERLKKIAPEIFAKTGIELENGVGIASGEVFISDIGSVGSRRDFLLVGDTVEKAEAVEAMTRQGAFSKVFVDQATLEMSAGNFAAVEFGNELVGVFEIKGEKVLRS